MIVSENRAASTRQSSHSMHVINNKPNFELQTNNFFKDVHSGLELLFALLPLVRFSNAAERSLAHSAAFGVHAATIPARSADVVTLKSVARREENIRAKRLGAETLTIDERKKAGWVWRARK